MEGAVDGQTDNELGQLVGRIRQGDRAAEHALVLRFQRAVRALVRRHCRPNEPLADDIVQEVLSDIVQRLRTGRIEDAQALPKYLQVAITHACAALYRRRARFSGDQDPEDTPDLSKSSDPADFRDLQEQSAILRDVVAGLPVARDREILRRFYFLEESRSEVCLALSIEESHFHRVVHRARERLREAWQARGH